MKKSFITFSLLIFSAQTFAFFCPKGFNQIEIGYTIDQVIQQCGNPDSKNTEKTSVFQPQEWNYYVKPDPSQPGTLRMSVGFTGDQKVVNITVQGTSVVSTTICGNNIQLGDSADSVKAACNKPAFINQSQQPPGGVSGPELTIFTYNGPPAMTLTFEGGKLKSRK